MQKKAAGTFSFFNTSNTRGVYSSAGPSSKLIASIFSSVFAEQITFIKKLLSTLYEPYTKMATYNRNATMYMDNGISTHTSVTRSNPTNDPKMIFAFRKFSMQKPTLMNDESFRNDYR